MRCSEAPGLKMKWIFIYLFLTPFAFSVCLLACVCIAVHWCTFVMEKVRGGKPAPQFFIGCFTFTNLLCRGIARNTLLILENQSRLIQVIILLTPRCWLQQPTVSSCVSHLSLWIKFKLQKRRWELLPLQLKWSGKGHSSVVEQLLCMQVGLKYRKLPYNKAYYSYTSSVWSTLTANGLRQGLRQETTPTLEMPGIETGFFYKQSRCPTNELSPLLEKRHIAWDYRLVIEYQRFMQ